VIWPRRRRRREAELDEEIQGHLAMASHDREARGQPPGEAAYAARREEASAQFVRRARGSRKGLYRSGRPIITEEESVKKLRIIILAQATWVLCGAAFLAATPARVAACDCPNGHCVSAYDCTYMLWSYCRMGPNWCTSTSCDSYPEC
jgi:hypothetical protein